MYYNVNTLRAQIMTKAHHIDSYQLTQNAVL